MDIQLPNKRNKRRKYKQLHVNKIRESEDKATRFPLKSGSGALGGWAVPAPKLLCYSSPSIRSALVTTILISIKYSVFNKIRNSAHSLHINATLNNISVMSWRLFYCWMKPEYPEKTPNLCKPLIKFITNIAIKEIYTQLFVSSNNKILWSLTFGSLNEYVIV